MPRYVFSGGKVTVEDGVYTPILRGEKRLTRGVLILAQSVLPTVEPDESTQAKEQNHV
ncbi:MAG TPA: hypothetical protein VHP83_01260 [Aggregatilineaceae bacterium]|nr:hypothetical protein [Aggregatilineaceae bacterium]